MSTKPNQVKRRYYKPKSVVPYKKPVMRSNMSVNYVVSDNDLFSNPGFQIKRNTLMGNPVNIRKKLQSGGSVNIINKEYIGDIVSTDDGTFKIQKMPINPGQEEVFPWLSGVSQNYQEYQFNGLMFHFRSMSADSAASGVLSNALGTVIMSTDYNAIAEDFSSKSEMENAQYAQSAKPSESISHYIECSRNNNVLSNLYIRSDSNVSNTDIRFSDLGNFYIASQGVANGQETNLGELWVSYDVTLYKTRLFSAIGEEIDYFSAASITGIANAVPLGNVQFDVSVNSNMNVVLDTTDQILTLPSSSAPKSYIMYLSWRGTRTASLNPPTTTFTNASTDDKPFLTSTAYAEAAAYGAPDTNAASDSQILTDLIAFRTSGSGLKPLIEFGSGVLPTAPVLFQVIFWQIPNTYDWTLN